MMESDMTKGTSVGNLASDGPSSASNGDVNTDPDEPNARFDDFTPSTHYTNGNSGSTQGTPGTGGPMYYITETPCPTTGYYNSGLSCSQGVNQLIPDGQFLVVELDPASSGAANGSNQRASPQTDQKPQIHLQNSSQESSTPVPMSLASESVVTESSTSVTNIQSASGTTPAAALLINPYTIDATATSQDLAVQTLSVTNPTITVSNTNHNSGGRSSGISGGHNHQQQHHNQSSLHNQSSSASGVRDMDIVHVQWLIDNYETAEGVSLPRSTLYSHYQSHCSQHGIDPVNAASFGKLIRSVFIGLRTRRLGTRGNSKYHYYGIRVKPGSALARHMETIAPPPPHDTSNSNSHHPPVKRSKSSSAGGVHSSTPHAKPYHHHHHHNHPPHNHGSSTTNQTAASGATGPNDSNHQSTLSATSPEVLQTHLGDPKSILPNVWPDEPMIPNSTDADSPTVLTTKFAACYRKHYEEIINCLGNLNFNHVEGIWMRFWQPDSKDSTHHKSDPQANGKAAADKNNCLSLSMDQLFKLTSTAPVTEDSAISSLADWIIQTDYTLYNALITSLLLPNLLKPIPQQLTQQIRNFAKNINTWMANALSGYDESFVGMKLEAVGAFSHTLRRYTSLNHLSSAARAVLQNQSQISQMISDLNRVDFKNVQEQAYWVCRCDDEMVEHIEQSFKSLLQQDSPFDAWSEWCEEVLLSCLSDATDDRSATQFFFKWGFYSSLVMRDLTLRSASSFGSFHLIRLLFDEYIFYLIEQRVAKANAKTPLQVLGEARSLRGLSAPSLSGDGSSSTSS